MTTLLGETQYLEYFGKLVNKPVRLTWNGRVNSVVALLL